MRDIDVDGYEGPLDVLLASDVRDGQLRGKRGAPPKMPPPMLPWLSSIFGIVPLAW